MNKPLFAALGGLIVLGIIFVGFLISTGSEKGTTMNTTPDPSEQLLGSSNSAKPKQYNKAPAMAIDIKKSYSALMHTSKGDITLELFADEVPQTVNNFVFLSRESFYNNTKFHRIMKGFMIQGGDPRGNGTGGPGYKFPDEPITHEYTRGTIAMANSGPDTNGSQFFIMHADYDLPKNYVIFGMVVNGLEIVDAIANTPVGSNAFGEPSEPKEDVTIASVEIMEK